MSLIIGLLRKKGQSQRTREAERRLAEQRRGRGDERSASSVLEEADPVPGRLKVCSKSLVFVPAFGDRRRPLVKFPLNECTKIDGNEG